MTLDAVRAAAAGPHRGDRAGPAHGVGGAGRRPAPPRAGPGRHRGRAGAPAGDRHRFDVEAPRPGTARLCTAEVDCSSGTYVRTLAADLGTPWAGEPTSATSGAPPSARSPSPTPCPLADLRSGAAAGGGRAGLVPRHRRPRTWWSPSATGRCWPPPTLGSRAAPARADPWAVLAADGALLAVYQEHDGRPGRSPVWCWPPADAAEAVQPPAGIGPARRAVASLAMEVLASPGQLPTGVGRLRAHHRRLRRRPPRPPRRRSRQVRAHGRRARPATRPSSPSTAIRPWSCGPSRRRSC